MTHSASEPNSIVRASRAPSQSEDAGQQGLEPTKTASKVPLSLRSLIHRFRGPKPITARSWATPTSEFGAKAPNVVGPKESEYPQTKAPRHTPHIVFHLSSQTRGPFMMTTPRNRLLCADFAGTTCRRSTNTGLVVLKAPIAATQLGACEMQLAKCSDIKHLPQKTTLEPAQGQSVSISSGHARSSWPRRFARHRQPRRPSPQAEQRKN